MWLPHGAFFVQVALSVSVRFLSERKRRNNLPGAEAFCKADGELLAHVGEKNGYSATQKRNRSPRQGIIKFPGDAVLRGILYREKDCRQTGDGVPAHCRKESDFRQVRSEAVPRRILQEKGTRGMPEMWREVLVPDQHRPEPGA